MQGHLNASLKIRLYSLLIFNLVFTEINAHGYIDINMVHIMHLYELTAAQMYAYQHMYTHT